MAWEFMSMAILALLIEKKNNTIYILKLYPYGDHRSMIAVAFLEQ